jgi:UDPglucose 6-dehydrogenase/GDP-mannose 6-dehydrogenase
LHYCDSWQEALADVDAIVLVTHWPEFEDLPVELDKLENPPLLVDGRRFLDKATITHFAGIGVS